MVLLNILSETLCTFIEKTHCFVNSNVYIKVNSLLFLLLAVGMYFYTIWTGGVLVPVSVMCTLGQATADPPTSHRVPADQRLRYVFL